MRIPLALALTVLFAANLPAQTPFKLAPAVALEAEDFTVESGWKVVPQRPRQLHGGYHRLQPHLRRAPARHRRQGRDRLRLPRRRPSPRPATYRLWVRYEYPAFCETRFRVVDRAGRQDGPRPRHGHEGQPALRLRRPEAEGAARPVLGPGGADGRGRHDARPEGRQGAHLPQGRRPAADAGRGGPPQHRPGLPDARHSTTPGCKHYARQTNLYPILDAFRDTRGPRCEVRFTNRGDRPADFRIAHVYNRIPWGVSEPADRRAGVAAGHVQRLGRPARRRTRPTSAWCGSPAAAGRSRSRSGPSAGAVERKLSGDRHAPRLPAALSRQGREARHAGWRRSTPSCADLKRDTGPRQEADAAALLRRLDAAGPGQRLRPQVRPALRRPRLPLAAPGPQRPGVAEEPGGRRRAAEQELDGRWATATRRRATNIEAAPSRPRDRSGMAQAPAAGSTTATRSASASGCTCSSQDEVARAKAAGKTVLSPTRSSPSCWLEWLQDATGPTTQAGGLLAGDVGAVQRRPAAARQQRRRPRPATRVSTSIRCSSTRRPPSASPPRERRRCAPALGDDVLCGANYSCHPFYYPHSTHVHQVVPRRRGRPGPAQRILLAGRPGRADDQRLHRRAFPGRHARQPAGGAAPVHHAARAGQHRRQLPAHRPSRHLAHGATHARLLRHRPERDVHREPHRPPRPRAATAPCAT